MIVVFPMVDQLISIIFLWLIQIVTENCRIAVMVLQVGNLFPEEMAITDFKTSVVVSGRPIKGVITYNFYIYLQQQHFSLPLLPTANTNENEGILLYTRMDRNITKCPNISAWYISNALYK